MFFIFWYDCESVTLLPPRLRSSNVVFSNNIELNAFVPLAPIQFSVFQTFVIEWFCLNYHKGHYHSYSNWSKLCSSWVTHLELWLPLLQYLFLLEFDVSLLFNPLFMWFVAYHLNPMLQPVSFLSVPLLMLWLLQFLFLFLFTFLIVWIWMVFMTDVIYLLFQVQILLYWLSITHSEYWKQFLQCCFLYVKKNVIFWTHWNPRIHKKTSKFKFTKCCVFFECSTKSICSFDSNKVSCLNSNYLNGDEWYGWVNTNHLNLMISLCYCSWAHHLTKMLLYLQWCFLSSLWWVLFSCILILEQDQTT